MVLSTWVKGVLLVSVDPAFPTAWQGEPYYSQLRTWAQYRQVQVRVGRRYVVIAADGTEKEITVTQAWMKGREEPGANPVPIRAMEDC
jgi:hypothetical protein